MNSLISESCLQVPQICIHCSLTARRPYKTILLFLVETKFGCLNSSMPGLWKRSFGFTQRLCELEVLRTQDERKSPRSIPALVDFRAPVPQPCALSEDNFSQPKESRKRRRCAKKRARPCPPPSGKPSSMKGRTLC